MPRLAVLVGKTVPGKVVSLGIAEGTGIGDLLELRTKIISKEGLAKIGSKEVQLSEIRTLSSETAGGELKARRKFDVPEPKPDPKK